MTLNPVFRSESSLNFLKEQGYYERLIPALEIQQKARQNINDLVNEHYSGVFSGSEELEDERIFENDFFLILFTELSRHGYSRFIDWYAKWNYCIRGKITAADNLFDGEEKRTLPHFSSVKGVLGGILELSMYEQLFNYLGKGIHKYDKLKRVLDLEMLEIGKLEGSEEQGVYSILQPDEMIEGVHRVRGGKLFGLSMIAPRYRESTKEKYWSAVGGGLNDLGTAFQIVDDITDFEFDLGRKSHNLVVSEVYYNGTKKEKEMFKDLLPVNIGMDFLESYFLSSSERVVERAYNLARSGFAKLQETGFWFDSKYAEEFVHAILGDKGEERIQKFIEEA
jgi:hypothetical protein